MHSTEKRIQYSDQATQRLDRFLTGHFSDDAYTRSFWHNMIEAGNVSVNGTVAKKAGVSLHDGDEIDVLWPVVDASYRDSVEVLYEANGVLALNKPAGMLTHSKGAFNPEYTVADFVAEHASFTSASDTNARNGIVHRLDRLTSGVMATARNEHVQHALQEQFASRKTVKRYLAIVEGPWNDAPGRIEMPLRRSLSNPKKQEPHEDGRQAETIVLATEVLSSGNTAVYLQPVTGRTHQLRVHLSHLNHPIVGDTLYGAAAITEPRILLHAHTLTVSVPEAGDQTFVAPVPEDMASYSDDGTIKRLTERSY